MASQIIENITKVLEEKFAEEDFKTYFLVELLHDVARNKVSVFIDSDGALSIDDCALFNRLLQQKIDEAGWLGEKYILDVSSPGISKPLKFARQYQKNVGRTLEITQLDGTTLTGKLLEMQGDHVLLELPPVKVKKSKTAETAADTSIQIPFSAIRQAIVQFSFS